MTRGNHDHGLRLAQNGLVILTSEGLGSILDKESQKVSSNALLALFRQESEFRIRTSTRVTLVLLSMQQSDWSARVEGKESEKKAANWQGRHTENMDVVVGLDADNSSFISHVGYVCVKIGFGECTSPQGRGQAH